MRSCRAERCATILQFYIVETAAEMSSRFIHLYKSWLIKLILTNFSLLFRRIVSIIKAAYEPPFPIRMLQKGGALQ